jgi:serine/threonine protein kinase
MNEGQKLISLKPGTLIAGHYEVVKCLGAGSMGVVYACKHVQLAGKIVAMKVLFPEVALDRVAAARFKNEIQSAYGVSHPNVVRAYEFIDDGNVLAYTMEYVGGGDLADRISDPENLLPLNEVLSIAIQMSQGVQSIHDAGIVHRDLKPENILLTKEGQVKIADFGIAKTGDSPRLTEHGGVVGTIQYVSPEYMLNAIVDWRSDIYAMGVLLFEMLTGTAPFKGESMFSTLSKSINSDAEAPSKIRSDLPLDFDSIVLRAMNRDPEKRYQSAQEMAEDLLQVAAKFGFNSKWFSSASFSRAAVQAAVKGNERLLKLENQAIESDLESLKSIKKIAQINRAQRKSNLLNPADPAQTQLLESASEHLASVMSGDVAVFQDWTSSKQEAKPSRKKTPSANSHSRNTDNKSYLFTLVIALVVGALVGFAVLSLFQPQVVKKVNPNLEILGQES